MGQNPSPSTHKVQPKAKKTPNKATNTWTRPNHQRTTHATGSKVKLSRGINIGKPISVASSGTRHNVHHQQQAWTVRGASNKMARVHCKNLLGFHCVGIEEVVGHRGGIWFLSSIANTSCVVIDQIDQCITVKVSVGHNGPWIAVGDFNEIVAPDESTCAYFSSHRASLLATTLNDCELFDLKVTSRRYTWYRAVQAGRDLAKRLDRALVNEAWMTMFPEGYSEILSRLHSDHCPILVRCHDSPRVKSSRSFREQWVKFGDRNTKFFHLQTLVRRNHNRVHGLYVRDGSWSTDPDILQEEALSFYKNLFGTTEEVEVDCLGDVPLPTLSTEACAKLIDHVSFAEVKSAVFSMSPFKGPGLDGFQAYFFKEYWEIVGTEIWNIVRSAFLGEFLNPSIMETLIVLIPKIDNPIFMKDFRPISLCNVVYKIITKVLTNRLRPFLPDIVSPLQGGFIPGRGAPDNIIVAQEILNFMKHTKSKKGTLAFKIDLKKAYDKVDWRFLESTLIAFGFPIIIVNLIMNCVRASSLSIIWNGNRLDSFAPRRGLRQGDPMSPYLFVLCMERLACYISQKVVEGVWKPVSVTRGGPKFSHLMFADDLLLFCQATKSQVQMVMHSLNIFYKASGMKVNFEKSKVFCSKNVTAHRRDIFNSVSSIHFALDLGRYLGVNLNHSRTSRASFHSVIEKVRGRLANWKGRLLNKAGRLCLINSVAASIPVYHMQFLWKGQVDGRGLSLVNWRTMITPKKFGGLGVRDPACDKPWVVLLRVKYLRNEGVLDDHVPRNASHVWKSISKAFGALKDAFSWCVGSLDQSFWFDNWSIEGPIAQDVPFVHISDSDLTIRDVWKDGQWNLHDIFSIIPEDVKQRLNDYNPDLNAGESSGWSWGVASSRHYSARSGYSWLAKRKFDWNEHDNWLWIWRLHIPEKYKFLIWLNLHNAIPMAEFHLGRGLALSSTCHRCQNDSESIFHCLRECPSAKEVWNLLGLYSDNSNLPDWLYRCAKSRDIFLFFSTIWRIWRSRNQDLFSIDDSWSASKVVSLIRSSVREFHTIFSMHQSLSPPSLCLHWVPPPVHSVKLNCDASWFAPFGYAGFGCIICNPDGCWLKGCTEKVEVCSVLFAELYAIWRSLLLAWESGFREVICETDCLEALFLVNQRVLRKDIPEWDLAKHIQEVMNWNWRVSILLIRGLQIVLQIVWLKQLLLAQTFTRIGANHRVSFNI
ncbi:uncharacterized protein LOC130934758 [Arachis stenosperma]|uniref:uncharacterized protein LOC130934758 n=1 Tax=Arachis stenosperma TaxID=217475 RepID=UPI0025AD889F|nr:uncharacterized protein LOC130934758 [Arachis stenosperma]